MTHADTIAAIATAAGAGGVGMIRLSGPKAAAIAAELGAPRLRPRHAHYARWRDHAGEVIDDGIVLWFPAPNSFTGEEVVELQGHGGAVVLRQLLAHCIALGARQARPGEFSERAFLNGKLDLAQAEAIADLIAAGDTRAARAARRSLDGVFSRRVETLAEQVTVLRIHVEAAIDFADEPIETLGGAQVRAGLSAAQATLAELLRDAERGRKLRDGLHAVLIGPPNAGKSSLLNALAGSERAIVTDVAGTTRDTLRETIRIAGLELTLVDTAGLRDSGDAIEREGMRRARAELARADLALVVIDAREPEAGHAAVAADVAQVPRSLWIHNKADLLADAPTLAPNAIAVSAATGAGLAELHERLAHIAGADAGETVEGEFTARARHVEALSKSREHLAAALAQLDHEQLELAAEELRLAHESLGEITGRMTADDLLGRIFSSFCIGK
ncbi:tRNA modification GTPase MnmE [Stenotrophomonas panacihumi]|uniref:tRNA modification GTPase MnmE n=1 Tax=Stenotrophomonas panacihumi TaxID=676599 RepID=A0A0Q9ZY79_9GAMM|nr:tRNA uridine-5-carboxymethylaminomethyl(34) synthesis GTPase MnmE [Stenotrophomonas panacihumi]KRG37867.1 tRNA modification GTPase MnmE [Stenotrophomonas panacihumi]PTN56080.1 tRNA uridine-5-carboxymethylaminomethyl(34) synthesis GTPase MnmE [Stenotrophomonas panacihumi]